ncbi:MAG: universal stress protein [Proteobacteria bacterium]|nr:universal stress protein [Pseudomonadota bacterium]
MYRRILVPFDGSDVSRHAFDEAVQLARQTGAALRLLHVVDAPSLAVGFEAYVASTYSRKPTVSAGGSPIGGIGAGWRG